MHRLFRKKRLLAVGFILIAVMIATIAAFLSWRQSAIQRTTGNRNLMMICIALLVYEDEHASFPPAYTTDRNGKRMHSWRTLLLPYVLGSKELYSQIDFDLPWDSPKNRRFAAPVPIFYRCPGNADLDQKQTCYVVVCDENSLWPGSKSGKLAADGSDMDRILVLEITHSDIEWMEPRDLTLKEALDAIQPERSTTVGHPRVVAYMTVAGDICVLKDKNDRELLYKRLCVGVQVRREGL